MGCLVRAGSAGRAPSGRLETIRILAVVVVALLSPCGGWVDGAEAPGAGNAEPPPVAEALAASAELVTLAGAVVIGTAEGVAPSWTADRAIIVTTYRIRLEVVLAGTASPTLDLVAEGGTVGDTSLRVSNFPNLDIGKRYLILVGDLPDRRCILGGTLGAFPLAPEEADRDASVGRIAAIVQGIRMAGGQ